MVLLAVHPFVEWAVAISVVVAALLAAIPKVRSAVAAAARWVGEAMTQRRALAGLAAKYDVLAEIVSQHPALVELATMRGDLHRLLKAVGENDGKSLHERIGTLEAEGRSLTERVTALEQAVYQERDDRER